MSHKVYKSGSCKRKYKKLQDEATKAVLANTPKLVHFLPKLTPTVISVMN